MKSLIALAFALASSLAMAQPATPAPAAGPQAAYVYKAKSPRLNRAQLDALLAKPEGVVIIDVRRPDELTKIGGFPAYLSIQAKELENNLGFIPKDRAVVTVSNHAGRAGAAADVLAGKGFKVAGAIGVQDYEAEGGTIAKISPPPAQTGTPVAEAKR